VPEGHTLHRLAGELRTAFGGRTVGASSPQGRFLDGAARIDGARFLGAEAVGKHLLVELRRSRALVTLHVHLGLYGGFTVQALARGERPPAPVGQVRLRLSAVGAFADLRGPTACELLDGDQVEALLARLGPDPLRSDADERAAWDIVSRSGSSIAVLLMRQDVVAGVGNVYRAEVLFRQGIDPMTPGRDLDRTTWRKIWRDLTRLMAEGVESGRIDTVRSQHLPHRTGRAARSDRHGGEVYVYRRALMPCLVCGTDVRTSEVAARNLFWCPTCQPSVVSSRP
jgi:endonuclease-8